MSPVCPLRRRLMGAFTAVTVAACTVPAVAAGTAPAPLSADARTLVEWVGRSANNAGAPFLVIDKRQARVWVFDDHARPLGSSPVLLGSAIGDDTAPGVGDKPLSEVKPEEKTTPAGRFVIENGRNLRNEDVFWIDYDAAVSMHRVLTTNPKERRLERLATPTPADNRISFGCVNVPVRFFEQTLVPTFSRAKGAVAYVLPETRPLRSVFAFAPGGAAAP